VLAGDNQADEKEAEKNAKHHQRPLILAGEEDEGEAVGELAEGGVSAVGDDGGGKGGKAEQDYRQEHIS